MTATQLTGIGGKKKPAEAAPVVVAKDQVGITERAAKKIAQLAEREGKHGQLLRVGIQGGGCWGLSYTFAFADKAEACDRIFDGFGQRIVVDAKSLVYLGGSVHDWAESPGIELASARTSPAQRTRRRRPSTTSRYSTTSRGCTLRWATRAQRSMNALPG